MANDIESAITRENRMRLVAVTGGWPLLLYDVAQRARTTMDWGAEIEMLEVSLADKDKARSLSQRFGLNMPEPCNVLQCMADVSGEVSAEDIHDFLDDNLPLPLVQLCIVWADLLRFVIPMGGGRWTIDPLVARILKAVALK